MNRIFAPRYNLEKTVLGGQAFNWDRIDGTYYGFTIDAVIKLRQEGDYIFWQTYPKHDDYEYVHNLLHLDLDYDSMLNQLAFDEHIQRSLQTHDGLRILNQDFEQTTLSFILASVKNIPAIRQSIRLISAKFGKKLTVDGIEFYTFPKAERLHEVPIHELLETKIGFRAKYVKAAAEAFVNEDLIGLEEGEYTSAQNKERLMKIPGIGDKIADCILVFSLGSRDITPLDVWGKRILTDLYKLDPKTKYPAMQRWITDRFGSNTAYAGQFLFEMLRDEGLSGSARSLRKDKFQAL